jgi:hypothetical protein
MLGGCRSETIRLLSDVSSWRWPDPHNRGTAVTMIAEFPLAWVIDGKRVQGLIAIGMPELVQGEGEGEGEGEATCTIALDGLQRRTTIHGEGKFHALLMGIRFIDAQIRDHVSKGVRAVFPGDVEDPESATASLLAMFQPLD